MSGDRLCEYIGNGTADHGCIKMTSCTDHQPGAENHVGAPHTSSLKNASTCLISRLSSPVLYCISSSEVRPLKYSAQLCNRCYYGVTGRAENY